MTEYQYAATVRAPKMWVATLVVAALAFGIPALLLALDPGVEGAALEAGASS